MFLFNKVKESNLIVRIVSFFPIFDWLFSVNRKVLYSDCIAGFIVSLVVIPQCIAFSHIAGIPVQYGFYTAIVIPIIMVVFSSSHNMVNGPTVALSVVIFSIVSKSYVPFSPDYLAAVITLTFLTGFFQIALLIFRVDFLIKFISKSVIVSFTAGAGVVICLHNVGAALGIEVVSQQNSNMWYNLYEIFRTLPENISYYNTSITIFTIVVSLAVSRRLTKGFATVIAIFTSSILAYILSFIPNNDVIFTRSMGTFIPSFSMVNVDFSDFDKLSDFIHNALTLALLSLVTSMAISQSLSEKNGSQVKIRQEFFGQGISNLIGSFFSTYVSAGSFSRSTLNADSGAVTPVSGLFTSLFVVIILFFAGDLITHLPTSTISGIVIISAIRIIDVDRILDMIKSSRSEIIIIAITFFSVLISGLERAIYIGMISSLFLFLRKTTKPRIFEQGFDIKKTTFRNRGVEGVSHCPQMFIFRIQGAIYYASSDYLEEYLNKLEKVAGDKMILLFGGAITALDWDGAHFLIQRQERWKGDFCITGLTNNIRNTLKRYHIEQKCKTFGSKRLAISYLVSRADDNICKHCRARIFAECKFKANETNDVAKDISIDIDTSN